MSRIESIRTLLADSPEDTFLLYSLGMELHSAGDSAEAVTHFRRLLEVDPDYLPAWGQLGAVLAELGDAEGARQAYQQGIDLATAAGDTHARDRLTMQKAAVGDGK